MGVSVCVRAATSSDATIQGDDIMAAMILVLEDDPALQELLRDVLQDEGHQVVAASTLPALLASLPSRPDLLISDILVDQQPVGLDAIKAVRNAYAQPIPAILCTAAATIVEQHQDQITTLRAIVLAKPFSIDGLLQAVENALGPNAISA
jgi:two-component system, NtrC family, response regulator HydG